MYKPKDENLIDTKEELKNILEYTLSKWDGFDKLSEKEIEVFFSNCWEKTLSATKNYFNQYTPGTTLVEKLEKLQSFKANPASGKLYIEAFYILMNLEKVYDNFIRKNWDYEKFVKGLIKESKDACPSITSVKPKGWAKLAKGYSDFDGIEEVPRDNKKFKGVNSETAGSSGFEIRTALPHVMYDEQCQGRKPLEVLIGSIVGHAMFVNSHNTTASMLDNINNIVKEFSNPIYPQLRKEYTLEPFLTHPILKDALKMYKDTQMIQDSVSTSPVIISKKVALSEPEDKKTFKP